MSALTDRIRSFSVKLKVVHKLGWRNTARVLWYRLQVSSGWFRRTLPVKPFPFAADFDGRFWPQVSVPPEESIETPYTLAWFGYHRFQVSSPPDWFANPFTGVSMAAGGAHWSTLPDFGHATGDIKIIWELSRFNWLVQAAWQARGQRAAGKISVPLPIDAWLFDWCQRSPVNAGVHWKCGQETSLRALHTLLATHCLCGMAAKPGHALLQFLACHLQRVLPTVHYAIGQATNHATSEAAALYIVGNVLAEADNASGAPDARLRRLGRRSQRAGRRMLEHSVQHLFLDDGTFCQFSVTYHRMVLDTLCYAELWRRHIGDGSFSRLFYTRLASAGDWLAELVEPASGDAPNLGSNDGVHLFNMAGTAYRDFRPSVRLAQMLFNRVAVFEGHDHPLAQLFGTRIDAADTKRASPELQPTGWDQLPLPIRAKAQASSPNTRLAVADRPSGGGAIALLPGHEGYILLRLPNFPFRPGHGDALHVDLWHKGRNILRDNGSYSYTDTAYHERFTSVSSHNTVQFDAMEQMPRLSRFLASEWIEPDLVDRQPCKQVEACYTHYRGGQHRRGVYHRPDGWEVRDEIAGFQHEAVLRWRLMPGNWRLQGQRLVGNSVTLTVQATVPMHIELGQGCESLYYLQQNSIPELRVSILKPGVITTMVTL